MMCELKRWFHFRYYAVRRFLDRFLDREAQYQLQQQQLLLQYKMARAGQWMPHESLPEAGFRCYSQCDEDGILLYLLAMTGMKTRKIVEICCGIGSESMAANLVLNHRFEGYLFDGDAKNITASKAFYRSKRDCVAHTPYIKQAWVTAENINDILSQAGALGEVDVLSLDIDGNDYWVWKAMEIIQPRICVFETHSIIPSDLKLTIPYVAAFQAAQHGTESEFKGASLAAMVALSRDKGYRLVGGHRYGFNAFFLRNDIASDMFPEVSAESVHANFWAQHGQKTRWPHVSHMPWVEV